MVTQKHVYLFCASDFLCYGMNALRSIQIKHDIKTWKQNELSFTQSSNDAMSNKLVFQIIDLTPGSDYTILINAKRHKQPKTSAEGVFVFEYETTQHADEIVVLTN